MHTYRVEIKGVADKEIVDAEFEYHTQIQSSKK